MLIGGIGGEHDPVVDIVSIILSGSRRHSLVPPLQQVLSSGGDDLICLIEKLKDSAMHVAEVSV